MLDLSPRNTADTADLCRGGAARNGSGPRRELLNSSNKKQRREARNEEVRTPDDHFNRHRKWGLPHVPASVLPLFSHRLLERYLEAGRENLRGTFCDDDHDVFAANAKFTRNVDAGLVRKSHTRCEHCFARPHEIGMLVAVEADAMAKAMREEFIIGAKAGGGDHRATGIVNGTRKFACAGRVEGRALGLADHFVRALDFIGRLSENAGACDIRLVALDGAAAIDKNDVALPQCLPLACAVGQRGGSAKQNKPIAP